MVYVAMGVPAIALTSADVFAQMDSLHGDADNAGLLAIAEKLKDYHGKSALEFVIMNGEDNYAMPGEMVVSEKLAAELATYKIVVNLDGIGMRGSKIAYWGVSQNDGEKLQSGHRAQVVIKTSRSKSTGENVLGYLGEGKKIAIVAHIDTAPKTIGALDNASGVAKGRICVLTGELTAEVLMPKNFTFYNPESHQQIIAALESGEPAAIISVSHSDEPTAVIQDGDFEIPVLGVLRELGYQVEQQQFDAMDWEDHGATLKVDGQEIPVQSADYSNPANVVGDLVIVDTLESLQTANLRV
ncbi:M28 family peptidase [Weissella confusa]|uniref:M28 family peptidase n=1 Tax=Weissella confusa TaxID=1583 RepID=A0A923SMW6_WEICO|nr:M28 family peptidase [Weissella confusa]